MRRLLALLLLLSPLGSAAEAPTCADGALAACPAAADALAETDPHAASAVRDWACAQGHAPACRAAGQLTNACAAGDIAACGTLPSPTGSLRPNSAAAVLRACTDGDAASCGVAERFGLRGGWLAGVDWFGGATQKTDAAGVGAPLPGGGAVVVTPAWAGALEVWADGERTDIPWPGNNQAAAVTARGELRILGKERLYLPGARTPVRAVAKTASSLSPDGAWLLDGGALYRLPDTTTGVSFPKRAKERVLWAPDSAALAFIDAEGITIYAVPDGRPLATVHDFGLYAVAPGGMEVAGYDPATGATVRRDPVTGAQTELTQGRAHWVTYTHDGGLLMSADGLLRRFDRNGVEQRPAVRMDWDFPSSQPPPVAFDASGTRVMIGGRTVLHLRAEAQGSAPEGLLRALTPLRTAAATPMPVRTGTVRGVVRAGGVPQADVHITIWEGDGGAPVAETTTDAQGRFTVDARGRALRLGAAGAAGGAWFDVVPGAPAMQVELLPRYVVNGHVTEDDAPTAGATVCSYAGRCVHTDAAGRFGLPLEHQVGSPFPDGDFRVTASLVARTPTAVSTLVRADASGVAVDVGLVLIPRSDPSVAHAQVRRTGGASPPSWFPRIAQVGSLRVPLSPDGDASVVAPANSARMEWDGTYAAEPPNPASDAAPLWTVYVDRARIDVDAPGWRSGIEPVGRDAERDEARRPGDYVVWLRDLADERVMRIPVRLEAGKDVVVRPVGTLEGRDVRADLWMNGHALTGRWVTFDCPHAHARVQAGPEGRVRFQGMTAGVHWLRVDRSRAQIVVPATGDLGRVEVPYTPLQY